MCQTGVEMFGALPTPTLSTALQNPLRPTMRVRMAEVAVDNLISRTKDNIRNTRQQPKAAADVAVSMHYLKGYQGRGGGL